MRAEKENRGVLFKNKRKTQDTHADYNGVLNVRGEEFWLNVWVNTSQSGTKYMAVRINPKEELKGTLKVVGGTDTSDPNDEIPF